MAQPLNLDKYARFALLLGEDTYASASAQSPETARRMQALHPSLAGDLQREQRHPKFLPGQLTGGRVTFLEQFNWFDSNTRTFVRFFFAATATKLYKFKQGTDSDWIEVTEVGTLAGIPCGRSLNNLFHFSDGATAWIFDGSAWVKDGLERPTQQPFWNTLTPRTPAPISSIERVNGVVTVTFALGVAIQFTGLWIVIAGVADSSFDGVFQVTSGYSPATLTFTYNQIGLNDATSGGGTMTDLGITLTANRYYWATFVDKTATRTHESSSGPRSVGTGPVSGVIHRIYPNQGNYIQITNGSGSGAGFATAFTAADVGRRIRFAGHASTYTITSVTDAQHLTFTPVFSGITGGYPYIIFPARATHWRLYASASEEDKAGLLLSENDIYENNMQAPFSIYDQSSFIGEPNSYFQRIERPLRNDPTHPTTIMEVHKRRIFRKLLTQPNYYSYTAYEEVLNLLAGAPEECVPGADADTVSDRVNESSYPDESDSIRAMTKHGPALYIATDDETSPLYGESIDDFAISDIAAFGVGAGGRFSMKSTPHGLLIGSNDKKLYLYPSQAPPTSDATSALIELSRPKRPSFEAIKPSDIDNWHIVYYNWGRRNWAVTCFQDIASVFHTFVFDFETKTWMELSVGFASLQVFEVADGSKVLIGGGADGYVYVIDDLTGTYAGSGNYPEGVFRTAPLDFGKPERDHVIYAVEYEKSDAAMDVVVTVYLDPADPDNPSGGITLNMTKTKFGTNRYRGFIKSDTGGTCQQAIVEFRIPASTVNGKLSGIAVYAETAAQFGAI